VQQSVFTRVRKMLDVAVGRAKAPHGVIRRAETEAVAAPA
jgi:hypothetical protein